MNAVGPRVRLFSSAAVLGPEEDGREISPIVQESGKRRLMPIPRRQSWWRCLAATRRRSIGPALDELEAEMTELEAVIEVETDAFTDELSDEALDRGILLFCVTDRRAAPSQ